MLVGADVVLPQVPVDDCKTPFNISETAVCKRLVPKSAFAPLAMDRLPAMVVVTVRVLLLEPANITLLKVVVEPVMFCAAPLKLKVPLLCVKVPLFVQFPATLFIPDPAMKLPLLVTPPLRVTSPFPELLQVAPAAVVTKPVNVFVPVDDVMVKLPVAPPPTVVVPVTLKLKAPTDKSAPLLIAIVPTTVVLAPRVLVPAPAIITLLKVVTPFIL